MCQVLAGQITAEPAGAMTGTSSPTNSRISPGVGWRRKRWLPGRKAMVPLSAS